VNAIFDEGWKRWGKSLQPTLQQPAGVTIKNGNSRDSAAYHSARGIQTKGWHLYAKENKTLFEEEGAHLHWRDKGLRVAHQKQKAFEALTPEEQEPFHERARKLRAQAKARGAPVEHELQTQAAPEVFAGPWSLSATKNGLPSGWPLHNALVERTVKNKPLRYAAADWDSEHYKVWGEALEVPDVDDIEEPCKPGECIHALTPVQTHRFGTLSEEFRLALRHHGLPAQCPLLFELVCGCDRKYFLIGDHDWTHKLRCDIIAARVVSGSPEGGFPYEVGLEREAASGQVCEKGWPSIQSETMFLLRTVNHSSNPWHMYALRTDPEQTWSYSVLEKVYVDVDAMRQKECARLQHLFALKLLKKVQEPVKDPRFKKARKGKGKGKRKGKRKGKKGRGGGEEETETESDWEEDLEGEPDEPPAVEPDGLGPGEPPAVEADDLGPGEPPAVEPDDLGPGEPPAVEPDGLGPGFAPPAVPPPPPPAAHHKVGEEWGNLGLGWWLAPIRNSATGEIIGCGATCKQHHDVGGSLVDCKKQVRMGKSGLSYDTMRLRMKRWLIAGLDEADWDAGYKRETHVGMGGRYMKDFEVGLSEEECDAIAQC